MATIGQLYKSKQTAATPRKVFWVPLAELYVEDGYNIRNMVHVSSKEFQDGGQEARDAVALKLLEARTRCRALAMMLPPIQ